MRYEAIRLNDPGTADSWSPRIATEQHATPSSPSSRHRPGWPRCLASLAPSQPCLVRLGAAFFVFGVVNNALYVVILTAALELLPPGVPTGVVACVNIAPSLVSKAVFPYILTGTVQYAQRIWACSLMSFVGLLVRVCLLRYPCLRCADSFWLQLIALTPSLSVRLIGIALASFSSGLGELTFLQLSTRYSHSGAAGHGVGWFASGTGGAGFIGAIAWWVVRPLGVKRGLSTLSPMPWGMVLAYFFLLPSPASVQTEQDAATYMPIPAAVEPAAELLPSDVEEQVVDQVASTPFVPEAGTAIYDAPRDPRSEARGHVRLSPRDKLELLRPMLRVYIIPLFLYVVP